MGERSWQEERETASDIAPAVRKAEGHNAGPTAPFLFCFGPYPRGWYHPHPRWPFAVLQKPFWTHRHRYTQRCVSMVILNPVKLTVTINHHSFESERLMGIQSTVSDAGSWGQRPAGWAPH